jgi:cytidylate kinase
MKENLLDVFTDMLSEGVYDPSIFKAFFLAGGPGSGKSYVVRRTTGGFGMKLINPDTAFEKILRDAGRELDMRKMDPDGRLGLILDGTGKDYNKISTIKKQLDTLGYDSYMIFVNTSLEVALDRNEKRARKLPTDLVKKSWNDVQSNMGKFQGLFGTGNMIIVDNNRADEDIMTLAQKRIRKSITQPIRNTRAKAWIKRELEKRKR